MLRNGWIAYLQSMRVCNTNRTYLIHRQVDLMSLVVCGIHKSVHAAYKARAGELSVSTTALYKKLSGIELGVSQALVRETSNDLVSLIQAMGGEQPSLLPGYRLKIVDGTCLAATEHRLDAIRAFAAKANPCKAIVILDPRAKLVTDIILCADGHAQERSLFEQLLSQVKSLDLWCGDRNFCTANFLFTIRLKKAFFVIRQHGSLGFRELSELKPLGETETGKLFEQEIEISYKGEILQLRRVLLKLFIPTRDKEWEIAILTNLPKKGRGQRAEGRRKDSKLLYRYKSSVLCHTVRQPLLLSMEKNNRVQTLSNSSHLCVGSPSAFRRAYFCLLNFR
ncbi:hypothetical protein NIES4073_51460 [Kalymmatonema gypsitolerans NIES-4073]|nr:hypothetical protein NIES4073_46500 [Scytonema sp. NIES-4073]BAZ24253.1 hypothetical protein NIES4073_51460 [Scytonema sp. NIES-4073]